MYDYQITFYSPRYISASYLYNKAKYTPLANAVLIL